MKQGTHAIDPFHSETVIETLNFMAVLLYHVKK